MPHVARGGPRGVRGPPVVFPTGPFMGLGPVEVATVPTLRVVPDQDRLPQRYPAQDPRGGTLPVLGGPAVALGPLGEALHAVIEPHSAVGLGVGHRPRLIDLPDDHLQRGLRVSS